MSQNTTQNNVDWASFAPEQKNPVLLATQNNVDWASFAPEQKNPVLLATQNNKEESQLGGSEKKPTELFARHFRKSRKEIRASMRASRLLRAKRKKGMSCSDSCDEVYGTDSDYYSDTNKSAASRKWTRCNQKVPLCASMRASRLLRAERKKGMSCSDSCDEVYGTDSDYYSDTNKSAASHKWTRCDHECKQGARAPPRPRERHERRKASGAHSADVAQKLAQKLAQARKLAQKLAQARKLAAQAQKLAQARKLAAQATSIRSRLGKRPWLRR